MQVETEVRQTALPWLERRNRAVARGAASSTQIVVERAHGAEVWDVDGKRYIDFAGGIGTVNAGHTPHSVVEAIARQAERLIHAGFPVAMYQPYIEVAERLAEIVPGQFAKKVLLINSGAEAVENAVKIARAYTKRSGVITFENAFHGRTLLAMSLTGKERPYKAGFGPFAPEVYRARFPYRYRCICEGEHDSCPIESGADLEQLFLTTVSPENVAAIIVEPVQGEGGFVVAPDRWLQALRRICDRAGIVMIVDEVQTGFGRTGDMLGIEESGVVPDLVVLAKSIAGGLPLAAVVGRAEIMDAPGPGSIGGTYSGNPVACAAALAVLDLFRDENLLSKGRMAGKVIEDRLHAMANRYSLIGEVRGRGPMQAVELVTSRETKEPAREQTAAILRYCHDHGLLIIKAGLYDNVIRFLAPLNIDERLLADGLDILEQAFAHA